MRRVLAAGVLTAFLGMASASWAQLPMPEDSLEAVLAPFSRQMAQWPPMLGERLRAHARHWLAMSPAEREAMRAALARWDALGPEEKLSLRERFSAWEALDEISRNAVLHAAERFAALPFTVQSGWRERFAALPEAQRHRFLFEPETRAMMDLAAELFPFVPDGERDATLQMLRALDASEIKALRTRVSAMSPGQRQALRERILALPADARVGALRAR